MVDPVTLVVLVAAGEGTSPMATAMVQATHDALGAAIVVTVRETSGAPTDAAVLAVEATSHPDAVVELVWDEPDPRRVTVRVHVVRTQWWLERAMTYAATDPVAERGRTLGLAVASILPEIGLDVSAPAPASAPASASAPAPASAPVPVSVPTLASAPVLSSDRVDATSPASPGPRAHVEVDLVASGATWISGSADTLGVGGSVQWFPLRSLALRIGASERSGRLNVAEATIFNFLGAAGVSLHPWAASPSRPIDASIRLDYLFLRQSATHFDADDPSPVTHARWLSGVDGYVDVAWLLSTDVAALAGVGVEDVLAPTYVNVRDRQVATIPSFRLVAELGVRLRF
jgi:hypothetical protein